MRNAVDSTRMSAVDATLRRKGTLYPVPSTKYKVRPRLLRVVAAVLLAASPASLMAQTLAEVVVSPAGPVRSISAALQLVRTGGRVVVDAGTYREPTILVTR